MVIQVGAQVVDDALADNRQQVVLQEREGGLHQEDGHQQPGQQVERAGVLGLGHRVEQAHDDQREGQAQAGQAFAIETSGSDLILRYAIADIGWFVADDDPVDTEAWMRGETIYMPDEKVSLYPPVLCEGAASLLPDGDKPAIIFIVRIASDGGAMLDGAERAVVRSRAKLGYATVGPEDLPAGFDELSRRIEAAEQARGASRVDPPQQEVVEKATAASSCSSARSAQRKKPMPLCHWLEISPLLILLYRHGTGLFRVMPEPDDWAIRRLRHSARALGVEWQKSMSLEDRQRDLDPNDPKQAAFMLAIRRAGAHASYAPFRQGVKPWHSAMRATYVHATAPLRRLADRFVDEAALSVANGGDVPASAAAAFERLPDVMNRADARAAQVDSAVLELAEAVVLSGCVGETFEGTVTDIDERGGRVQLADPAVITRVPVNGFQIGELVRLRLEEVDQDRRLARFSIA